MKDRSVETTVNEIQKKNEKPDFRQKLSYAYYFVLLLLTCFLELFHLFGRFFNLCYATSDADVKKIRHKQEDSQEKNEQVPTWEV